MDGYFFFHRKAWDGDFGNLSPMAKVLFLWILSEVNIKDTKFCKAGEMISSYREIRQALSWKVGFRTEYPTKSTVQCCLRALKKSTMVSTMKSTRKMIIFVPKWKDYQVTKSTMKSTTKSIPEVHTITEEEGITEEETKRGGKEAKFDPIKEKLPKNLSFEVWRDWVNHRKEIKKPLTKTMVKSQLKMLGEHHSPNEVIKLTITSGWTGLFPDKVKEKRKRGLSL